MQAEFDSLNVRLADLAGPDKETVSPLVEAYLRQTESEKASHLGDTDAGADLPERYHDEDR